MVAVLALDGSGNDLILLEAGQSVLVLSDEGAQRVPAHIAAVSSGAGVGGVLGSGILEGDLAGVDLIKQLLGAGGQSGVVLAFLGGQQDVARALSAVELLAHGLGLGERSVVALTLGILSGHGLGELRLKQIRTNDVLDVGLLGHAGRLESLLEGLIRLEHGLGLLHGGIDVGLLHGHVVLFGGLIVEILVDVVVDDLLAHGLGGVAVGDHPLAPRLIGLQRAGGAEVGDVIGDRLLHDVLAVDRRGHRAAAGTVAAAAHQPGTESDAERNRSHALQSRALERGKFHVSSTFHDIASALLPAQAHRAHSRSLRGTPALPS